MLCGRAGVPPHEEEAAMQSSAAAAGSPPMASVESFSLSPYHSPVEMALRRRANNGNHQSIELIELTDNFGAMSTDNKAEEMSRAVFKIIPVTNKLVETVNNLALRL